MEKHEDLSICAACGGKCCKKSGCDYFVSDFESIKIDYLDNLLKQGYTSIVAALDFKQIKTGQIIVQPILYLRARNINRDIIDLLSMKTQCLSLQENGCRYSFEQRPSGGTTLIPKKDFKCYSEVDRISELNKWLPYQNVLQRLVKRYTHMSVDAKLREDAIKLFEDIFEEKFDGVQPIELMDIKNLLPHLVNVYPEEYNKVASKYLKRYPLKKL